MTSYNQQSRVTEVHVLGSDPASPTNYVVTRGWSPSTGTATAEIRHGNENVDANHNVKPSEFIKRSKISSVSSSSSSSLPPKVSMKTYSVSSSLPQMATNLRRIQSESAAAEMRPGTERTTTTHVRGGGTDNMTAQVWGTENVRAEYRDTGHATVTTEVKQRGERSLRH